MYTKYPPTIRAGVAVNLPQPYSPSRPLTLLSEFELRALTVLINARTRRVRQELEKAECKDFCLSNWKPVR